MKRDEDGVEEMKTVACMLDEDGVEEMKTVECMLEEDGGMYNDEGGENGACRLVWNAQGQGFCSVG